MIHPIVFLASAAVVTGKWSSSLPYSLSHTGARRDEIMGFEKASPTQTCRNLRISMVFDCIPGLYYARLVSHTYAVSYCHFVIVLHNG